ncbi:MAG: phosphotransferase, partial [Muribaculum sp.]|nr:phosphotransferase [Muribaculum sp.]
MYQYFSSLIFSVARILDKSADLSCYIVEDLGDTSLFDCLGNEQLIEKTVAWLPSLQLAGAEGLDFSKCYPVEAMDSRSVMWDLNYFKYCFLKPTGIEFDESQLESEFERFSTRLLDSTYEWGFMYRDFQSRNVMIVDDNPYFIDFQGGRRGPIQYDLVSFLWQARAGFSPDFRLRMVDAYMDNLAKYVRFDRKAFRKSLKPYILFRLLQVLGAYGFRGLVQNKTHFIVSIVPAVKSLAYELENGVAEEYPYLKSLLMRVIESEMFSVNSYDGLTVRVNSFGFRKSGIPRDMSGNGGGFVFDCRALPNPGRLNEYKPLTGRDKAVRDYLEQYEEVEEFFSHASAMSVNAVKRYLERGF